MIDLIFAIALVLIATLIVVMRFVPSLDGMTSPLGIVVAVLAVLYVGYVVFEHYYYEKQRKKIGKIIHVNGIRGKSTVTRLIDAGLREFGYKVVSKTTGTVPTVIDADGNVKPIKRLGPANIREQLKMLDLAAKQHADFLVVECMAVNPDLQYACEHRILHSDVGVVTNVRADHLDQMGDDLESIAYSLANTTPKNATLVLGEGKFFKQFDRVAYKLSTKVLVADDYDGTELLDTFPDNIATALKVCEALGLDKARFFEGMKKYVHDVGALSVFTTQKATFINGFSINDPDSTLLVYDKLGTRFDHKDVTVLLNERPDRPFRIDQHVEMLTKMQFKQVLITGSNKSYVKRKLLERGITAGELKNFDELSGVVFGCGNIAADGIKIIDFFKQNGEETAIGTSELYGGNK